MELSPEEKEALANKVLEPRINIQLTKSNRDNLIIAIGYWLENHKPEKTELYDFVGSLHIDLSAHKEETEGKNPE